MTPYQLIFSIMPKRIQNRIMAWWPPFLKSFQVKFPFNVVFRVCVKENAELFKYIFWKGCRGFEWNSVKLFMVLSQKSRRTFDIGGYVGYYSILAKKTNPSTDVFVFEPVPNNFSFMLQLLAFNEIKATCEQIAIGEKVGYVNLFLPKKTKSRLPNIGSLKNRFERGGTFSDLAHEKITVQSTTLDDYCNSLRIKCLDLIKIDVEGFEAKVIQGGLTAISKFKPDFISEVSQETGITYCSELLGPLGYRTFDISDRGLKLIVDDQSFSNFDTVNSRSWFGEIFCSCKTDKEIEELNELLVDLA